MSNSLRSSGSSRGGAQANLVPALSLSLLESRIHVTSEDPGLLTQLAQGFEETTVDHDEPAADLAIRLDPDQSRRSLRLRTRPPDALKEQCRGSVGDPLALLRVLVQWAVSQAQRHYVFHAGAVARNGGGILMPASTHHGKSTLTAGLAQRGFQVLSDEVGAIDVASGQLVPFPRALCLRSDTLPILGLPASIGASLGDERVRLVRADDLGAKRAATGVEPVLVIVPNFKVRAPTALDRLQAGPAVISLMQSSCSQSRFKVAGLDLVIDLAQRVRCFELVFSNLGEALDRIETVFAEVCSDGD